MSKTALEIVRELAAARDKEEAEQRAARKKQEEEKLKAVIAHWEPVTKIIQEVFDAYPNMGSVILPPINSTRVRMILVHPVRIESPSLGAVKEFSFFGTSVFGRKMSEYMLHTADTVEELIPFVVSLMADAVRAYENKKP